MQFTLWTLHWLMFFRPEANFLALGEDLSDEGLSPNFTYTIKGIWTNSLLFPLTFSEGNTSKLIRLNLLNPLVPYVH